MMPPAPAPSCGPRAASVPEIPRVLAWLSRRSFAPRPDEFLNFQGAGLQCSMKRPEPERHQCAAPEGDRERITLNEPDENRVAAQDEDSQRCYENAARFCGFRAAGRDFCWIFDHCSSCHPPYGQRMSEGTWETKLEVKLKSPPAQDDVFHTRF